MKAPILMVILLGTLLTEAHAANEWCRADLLAAGNRSGHAYESAALDSHSLAVFYVVPSDLSYEAAVHERILEATRNVRAWYQVASGGVTWNLAFPDTVHVYYAANTRQFYKDHGDWWGSLLAEMGTLGEPIWQPGVVAAIWARGAGWWAGGAQWCGVDCGVALLGVEAFPEFNIPAYSGGTCPGGTGVASWPCTPEGAYAHELGHCLGLPHPADVPATNAVASHSVMQTHWNYPVYAPAPELPWGLLSLERQTIQGNPFMTVNQDLAQIHEAAEVVNLPSTGGTPTASFDYDVSAQSVTFTNTSAGASLYYWTFGDSGVSNDENPTHIYDTPGTYTVRLRASAANAMMSMSSMNLVTTSSCLVSLPGDANDNDVVTSSDIIYLVGYVFKAGLSPLPCTAAGDMNCNGTINSADIIYLVNHVFKSGSAPCDVCTLVPATWSCP